MKLLNATLPLMAAMLVSACGGGSSGVSVAPTAGAGTPTVNTPIAATAPVTVTPPSTVTPPVQTSATLTGRFVDSAVVGMQYSTATQSGETGADGSFNYLAGESVTFSIGDIVLPPTSGADVITPLSVFSTTDIADLRVINLARLLQTLDTDGDPTNGIVISDAANASAAGLAVDFASPAFDNQMINLIANSGSVNTELVEGIDALDHLQETLFLEGIQERPAAAPQETQTQTPVASTNNPATHPLVGRSAEFSDFAHDIAGTMTVIDDRTIEVTNFNYDGGGPEVFFYYGMDGDYRNGGPIGPQLNGRRYENETITLTIPDGLSLDDFNGLSVWCVIFFANFGDAEINL